MAAGVVQGDTTAVAGFAIGLGCFQRKAPRMVGVLAQDIIREVVGLNSAMGMGIGWRVASGRPIGGSTD